MAKAKVTITADNQMSPGLLQAKKAMMEFSQTVSKVGSTLKSAFGVTTAIVAVKKLGDALAGSFKDFSEAERKYKQLSITLGNGKAFESVKKNIKGLSKLTLSTKDDIEGMVSTLAGMGKSADEVNSISEAAVYLSNVTGKDLTSSMNTLLTAANGTTKELKKILPEVGDLTKAELENGAAVQLVIDKYAELSRSMAEADNSQHIQNIKNNFGDIKQSIGDLVSFVITPLIGQVDAFSEKLSGSIDEFVQKAEVVLGNFPEVMSRLWTAIKGGLSKLFSVDGIKNLVQNVWENIKSKIKLMGNLVANLMSLVQGISEQVIKGIGNYAMYWVTSVADQLGVNISEVINSIGQWLTESPIGKIIDQVLSKAINGVRLVGNIIKNIPQIVKIAVSNIGTIIGTLFTNIPKAIGQLFVGLGNKVAAFALKLKNDLMQAIEDVVNGVGEKISSTWLGRWFGLGEGMRDFDIGVNRSNEYRFDTNATAAFSNARNYLSNIGEDLAPMMDEIRDLLNPAFEKWSADNATTIGAVMANWTAKSSDEYYKAAKENFSNIGDFLQDWGETFLGDLGDDWADLKTSFSDIFSDAFGEDFGEFLDWFRPFMEEKLKTLPGTGTSTGLNGGGGGEDGGGSSEEQTKIPTFLDNLAEKFGEKLDGKLGGTASQWAAGASSALDGLTSNLGEAGTLVKDLAANMATMGPIVGAIVTALKYVIEGFAEVVSGPLNDFVKYGIEPLKEIGRVIGELLIPIFETLMPLVEESARFLIGIFDSIGIVLKPVIQTIMMSLSPVLSMLCNILEVLMPVFKAFAKIVVTITGTIQYVIQTLQHWVATLMNWLAGLNIMGWHPFEGLAMKDPGAPGDYGKFIQNKWGEIDAAFDKGASVGTSTATAISSAGYQGATQIIINIYQQAPVVGDGGMRQFASMIREEFSNLDYYGVTA